MAAQATPGIAVGEKIRLREAGEQSFADATFEVLHLGTDCLSKQFDVTESVSVQDLPAHEFRQLARKVLSRREAATILLI